MWAEFFTDLHILTSHDTFKLWQSLFVSGGEAAGSLKGRTLSFEAYVL